MSKKYHITSFDLSLHKDMLDDFNKRIDRTGLRFDYNTHQLLKPGSKIFQEQIVLVEDEEYIRCAAKIKNQNYLLKGKIINFQDIQIPISESIIDRKYLPSNLFFLKNLSNLSKNMHALGMGGVDEPLPKILNKLGFDLFKVDFFFLPLKISTLYNIFINKININLLKNFSFIFKPLDSIISLSYKLNCFKNRNIKIKIFEEFTEQDTLIWEAVKNDFHLIAEKKAENLNIIYSSERFKLTKLRIYDQEEYLGWLVLKITRHERDKYFADEKTCTIVDLCTEPCNYNIFIKTAKRIAFKDNAGVILMNSLNKEFNYFLKKNLFINSNSNFAFASKLENQHIDLNKSWITRGDGDGPINL